MKKLLSILTVLALLLCCVMVSSAEEKEPKVFECGDFSYIVLEDGTAEIAKYSGKNKDLVVPGELDGFNVSGIGDYAFSNSILTSISIPDSVTGIGNYAFNWCVSLTSILIPNSVMSIGNYAFNWCTSLVSITIPDSVFDMGSNPFNGCSKLENLNVSPDHPYLATIDGVLFSKPDKRLICYPCVFTKESYSIPKGILKIEESAFNWCNSLISVSIPDSVISIGNAAFSWCRSLTSVWIPNSVKSIGDNAFSYCSSLVSVSIPDSVSDIGKNPFSGCRRFNEIIVSSDHPYLTIMDGALLSKPDNRLICYPSALAKETYSIPNYVKEIEDSAFSECIYLTTVSIPDSVTCIGIWAFEGCESLLSVSIPDSVMSIGDDAFYGCKSLTITVPHDSYALQYCKDNGINYIYPDSLDWLNN